MKQFVNTQYCQWIITLFSLWWFNQLCANFWKMVLRCLRTWSLWSYMFLLHSISKLFDYWNYLAPLWNTQWFDLMLEQLVYYSTSGVKYFASICFFNFLIFRTYFKKKQQHKHFEFFYIEHKNFHIKYKMIPIKICSIEVIYWHVICLMWCHIWAYMPEYKSFFPRVLCWMSLFMHIKDTCYWHAGQHIFCDLDVWHVVTKNHG